ncbi:MAG TPA: hypothetical protein VL485_14790 [Ktedonobacteraceae bacterium]|nr:hypothetical protein [Ktedonobacteraceae bacterium]
MPQLIYADEKISQYPLPKGKGTTSQELLKRGKESFAHFRHLSASIQNDHALMQTIAQVQKLLAWDADISANIKTVRHAESWIYQLFSHIASLTWITPNVTLGSEGEVVLEWWYKEKKLTVYISDTNVEYVQVWGADIYTEMDDGDAEPINTCRLLWMWLRS